MFWPAWMRWRIESARTCANDCISCAVYGEYTNRALRTTVWNRMSPCPWRGLRNCRCAFRRDLLAHGLDRLHATEFFLGDIGESDSDAHVLRRKQAEGAPHEVATRAGHDVLTARMHWAGRPMRDGKRLPVRAAFRALVVGFSRRRIAALPTAKN